MVDFLKRVDDINHRASISVAVLKSDDRNSLLIEFFGESNHNSGTVEIEERTVWKVIDALLDGAGEIDSGNMALVGNLRQDIRNAGVLK